MRIDLRLQVAQLHIELLALQLVGDDLLLVFLALVIEYYRNGIYGDKPYQTHQKGHDKALDAKKFTKLYPLDKM